MAAVGSQEGSFVTALQSPHVPPQSLEAEQAILGGLLVDPDAIHKVVERIRPQDFYREAHETIYEAAITLFERGEPLDVITVSEWLASQKVDDKRSKNQGIQNLLEKVGGRSYINELALSVITTENLPYYGDLIHNKALLRELITAGNSVVTAGYEYDDASDAIDVAQQAVFKVAQQTTSDDLAHVNDILPITWEQIEERSENPNALMGTSTGFYDLDNYTSGFQKSDLVILAARPSMGKTAFALNLASHVALYEKKPVLIFSLEMSKESMVSRILCGEAEVDSQRIRTGQISTQDWERLSKAMARIGESPMYIDDTANMTVMEMRAKARKLMMETGEIGLIVIDYLQLMSGKSSDKGGGENRSQEISQISRGLKGLARELNAPVMALSQLSRAVESRQDKKPMLSDLRESGSIEQDADLVMFIYRDEYYNPDSDRAGISDIIIAKQRNGPVGTINLIFNPNITRFRNMEDRTTQVF